MIRNQSISSTRKLFISSKKWSMRTNSNLETLWDLVWIENKGICSRKKTKMSYMLKEEEVVEDIKLKLSMKEKRRKIRYKTKTVNEREIEVDIKLSKKERSRKRDNKRYQTIEKKISKIWIHIQQIKTNII